MTDKEKDDLQKTIREVMEPYIGTIANEFIKVREEMREGFAKVREEMREGFAELKQEIAHGAAQLTAWDVELKRWRIGSISYQGSSTRRLPR